MKKISVLISFLLIIISFTTCKKDNVSPSFVDDYDAPLTEEKGTEHLGDFFPLEQGYYWDYSGYEEVLGEMTVSAAGYSETEPINESGDIYSYLLVGAIESINLTSGTYSVYPLAESYSADAYSYRYFEKASDAVYFRAYMAEGGVLTEVEEPLFIKKPLVVGDSWETQPSIDINSALSSDNLGLTTGETDASVICKTYVIGKESMSWDEQLVEPIRLDQRAEAIISLPFTDEETIGKIDMNLKMTNSLYLLENVGLIKQLMEMEMTMNVSFTESGQKIMIKMNVDSDGILILDNYDFNGSTLKKITKKSNIKNVELNMQNKKVSKAINNILKKLFVF